MEKEKTQEDPEYEFPQDEMRRREAVEDANDMAKEDPAEPWGSA